MKDVDLEFRHVAKNFGDVRAVDDVSFRVRRGEFLSLLGPSGCGKTTSLRMIAGFERPTAGEIFLDGRPVGDTPPYRRNVNTVFQHYALFPHKSVFDNVAFGLRMKRLAPAAIAAGVDRMLALVELPGIGGRFPHQLSGGQQQRVALARALINEPTVLLLDEPLGALDLKVRRRMQQELKRIHREVGVTFVYVTHDQEEALTMSDRIAVMSHGRIEQLDTPATIYERPATRFVASFIGLTNLFPGAVEAREGPRVIVHLDGGLRVRADAPAGTAPGAKVDVAVRPEKIQMALDKPAAAANTLQGTVVDFVYQGAVTEYQVAPASGPPVRVVVQNSREAWEPERVPVGHRVYLSWPEGASLVLPADAAERAETGEEDKVPGGGG
ncbi:MAG TPA: ABC transporter ATP-binding protein [Methylomirabilota bacterium]|nr:ABC transporter ATP-binding protein [Methylomirabilota bacterium]